MVITRALVQVLSKRMKEGRVRSLGELLRLRAREWSERRLQHAIGRGAFSGAWGREIRRCLRMAEWADSNQAKVGGVLVDEALGLPLAPSPSRVSWTFTMKMEPTDLSTLHGLIRMVEGRR